jgi:type I restriction enzyme S subunit
MAQNLMSPEPEWIDQIPEGWESFRVDSVFLNSRKKNVDRGIEAYLSLMANVGVIPFSEKGNVGNKPPEDFSNCKVALKGDFILNSMNFGIGSFGIAPQDGILSPVYFVLRRINEGLEQGFLRYVFSSKAFREFVQMLGSGILEHRAAIPWDKFKGVRIPAPSASEQRARAEYLDQETSQIDALISKKEQLIEKLLERRQALITQFVTKGLDPNVPMKDSGVDWLGKFPSDWKLQPLWSHFRRVKRVGFPDETLLSVYREHGVLPKDSRDDNHNVESEDLSVYQLVEKGSLVVNKMKAWQGSLSISNVRGIVSPAYFVYEATSQAFESKFIHHLLRSKPYVMSYSLISKGVRVGQWDLQPELFRQVMLIIPGLDEQREIAKEIDRETDRIDTLVEKTRKAIELLKERRQALITQVVTGKIDVRGVAGGNS